MCDLFKENKFGLNETLGVQNKNVKDKKGLYNNI
jgi:hypothetical protein